MTQKQLERLLEIKRQRAALKTPFERIEFDNQANTRSGDEMILFWIAAIESKGK